MKSCSIFYLFLRSIAFALILPSCSNNAAPAQPGSGIIKAPVARGARRILFVGNSLTQYYISIPDMFMSLCLFNRNDIKEERIIEMGVSLQDICNGSKDKVNAACAHTDPDGNYYDYIVLQEKTPVVLKDSATYHSAVRKLMAVLRKNSPGAVFLIYEVMPRAAYDQNRAVYDQSYRIMKQRTEEIVNEHSNTRMYRVSDAFHAAYQDAQGYRHLAGGKDRLRFGDNTLHPLNDGGFLAATLLYAIIFSKEPVIPSEMPFSTGTGHEDVSIPQSVSKMISDPWALVRIAMEFK